MPLLKLLNPLIFIPLLCPHHRVVVNEPIEYKLLSITSKVITTIQSYTQLDNLVHCTFNPS